MTPTDWAKLASMERLVAEAMAGGEWLSPSQVRRRCGLGPEAEVKAAMRRIRQRATPLDVESRRLTGGGWVYRLINKTPPVPEWAGLPLFEV